MILPQPKDALHKAWAYRLLTALYDDMIIADTLYFKGGTCAAMLGYLDRFSVDLDFDYVGDKKQLKAVRQKMEKIFKQLGLTIKDSSVRVPQYFLKYPAQDAQRNTIKIDVTLPPPQANEYEVVRFSEIDRMITCQTKETMFANKLVALIDRYKKTQSIAGRDIYDIHHFFLQGMRYNPAVITERTNKKPTAFLHELIAFVEKNITTTVLTQDLNILLPYEKFKQIRTTLKEEVLMFLKDELNRSKK